MCRALEGLKIEVLNNYKRTLWTRNSDLTVKKSSMSVLYPIVLPLLDFLLLLLFLSRNFRKPLWFIDKQQKTNAWLFYYALKLPMAAWHIPNLTYSRLGAFLKEHTIVINLGFRYILDKYEFWRYWRRSCFSLPTDFLTDAIFESGASGVPSKSQKSFICGGVRQTITLKSPGKGALPSTSSWGLQWLPLFWMQY